MCQSAASAHVALAAKHARYAATGLYSSFYYLGGSVGASVLGVTWHYGHWPACIGLVLVVQMIAGSVAYKYFGVTDEPANPEVEKTPLPPEFG
jgi:MFS family permease